MPPKVTHASVLYTSLEGIKDEEVKSLAPTRCQISTKATWSYVVAVSSLRSFGLVSQRDFSISPPDLRNGVPKGVLLGAKSPFGAPYLTPGNEFQKSL